MVLYKFRRDGLPWHPSSRDFHVYEPPAIEWILNHPAAEPLLDDIRDPDGPISIELFGGSKLTRIGHLTWIGHYQPSDEWYLVHQLVMPHNPEGAIRVPKHPRGIVERISRRGAAWFFLSESMFDTIPESLASEVKEIDDRILPEASSCPIQTIEGAVHVNGEPLTPQPSARIRNALLPLVLAFPRGLTGKQLAARVQGGPGKADPGRALREAVRRYPELLELLEFPGAKGGLYRIVAPALTDCRPVAAVTSARTHQG